MMQAHACHENNSGSHLMGIYTGVTMAEAWESRVIGAGTASCSIGSDVKI